jgi:hypothetical protein
VTVHLDVEPAPGGTTHRPFMQPLADHAETAA